MRVFSSAELARARREQHRALGAFPTPGDFLATKAQTAQCKASRAAGYPNAVLGPGGVCCTQGMDFLGTCITKLPNGTLTVSESDIRSAVAAGAQVSVSDPWTLVMPPKDPPDKKASETPRPMWPWVALAGATGLGLVYYVSRRPHAAPSSHGPPRRA